MSRPWARPPRLLSPSSAHLPVINSSCPDHSVLRSHAAQPPFASRAPPHRSCSCVLSSPPRFPAMTASQRTNANVRLLAYLIDGEDTDDSDCRFLVDGQPMKY